MFKTGLVSVTFRRLDPAAIIELCVRAGLDGIEWGGDIHVPHGDLMRAGEVSRMTQGAGLSLPSYGSYYYAGGNEADGLTFASVLETALALQAANIRVWAGRLGSREADAGHWARVVHDTRRICEMAAPFGLTVSIEYHGGTLTDTPATALRLHQAADCANLRLYWQPAVGLTVAERADSLRTVRPFVSHCHVFHWAGQDRLPLAAGQDDWRLYLNELSARESSGPEGILHACLLEFVRNDDPEQFLADAAVLKTLLAEY